MNKIGGEFELTDLSFVQDLNANTNIVASGRHALRAILRLMASNGKNRIHIPYYICESVVNACLSEKFTIVFYNLNSAFQMPLDYLENIDTNDVLLTVCYFGLINDSKQLDIIKNRRPDITTISDHVMSFWTCKFSNADYSFTSFRKHFAVPEGALVYQNGNLFSINSALDINDFHQNKYLGSLLKGANAEESIYLKYFKMGEAIIDRQTENLTRVSYLGLKLFNDLNLTDIKRRRLSNTKFVYDFGSTVGLDFLFNYPEWDSVPQHVPIRVNDSKKLQKSLFSENIYLPIHWPTHLYNRRSELSKEMENHSISLIVDQRYSITDMERMIINLMRFN